MTQSYPLVDVNMTTDPHSTDGTDIGAVSIAPCATIRQLVGSIPCRDGDVFSRPNVDPPFPPGTRLTTVALPQAADARPEAFGAWTVPSGVRALPASTNAGPGTELFVTPGAIAGVALPPDSETWSLIHVDQSRPDGIEYVRNALAAHPVSTFVEPLAPPIQLDGDQKTFVDVRDGLLIGSLFTLGLAGVSLLVLALEQVRERRRPLAMLAASGVSRAVLARSLLWQTAVPVAVAVVAAIATGIGLALLVLRISRTSVVLDWADVGIFSVAAAVLVLLVTAATLPALRSATRLSSLRTE